jgi:dTDP-4-dehydrorhamnose reductase
VTDGQGILFTGGSGLLGGELRRLFPAASFPAHAELDVTEAGQLEAAAGRSAFSTVVHAAASTSPPRVDRDPSLAIAVNIVGTANVVRLCMTRGLRLVYISTDYVFRGDRGMYREEDELHPVNKYGWSKLGGECAVRLYDRALIVRTSFGPNEFPYPKALVDQYTSRESVRAFAEKLAPLIESDVTGVLHLGGPRRTVYEYALSLAPDRPIGRISIAEVGFAAPRDTSLDCSRYEELLASLGEKGRNRT